MHRKCLQDFCSLIDQSYCISSSVGRWKYETCFLLCELEYFNLASLAKYFSPFCPFIANSYLIFFFIVHFTQFYRVFRAFYRHSLSLSHQKHDKSFIFTIDLVISFQTSQNSITFLMFISWALLMGNIFYVANLQKQNSM